MFHQLAIGAFLIALTVAIHAVALDRIMMSVEWMGPLLFRRFRHAWKIPMLIFTVLAVFCALVIDIWLWAAFFLLVGAVPTFETALYFSTVVFCTLGFGDIILDLDWRLLSSITAANGMLLFGWSTVFIYEVMSKLYAGEHIHKTKP